MPLNIRYSSRYNYDYDPSSQDQAEVNWTFLLLLEVEVVSVLFLHLGKPKQRRMLTRPRLSTTLAIRSSSSLNHTEEDFKASAIFLLCIMKIGMKIMLTTN